MREPREGSTSRSARAHHARVVTDRAGGFLERPRRRMRRGVRAGAIAAVTSGAPSTVWALVRGRDPVEATLAAGSILLPRDERRWRLVAAAVPVHLAVSLGWGLVLARVLPPRRAAIAGAAAGLAIAAVDVGLLGRRYPRIRALPLGPQLADHVVYGATVGWILSRGRGG